MKWSDAEIVRASRHRIARIFGMPVENVRSEHVFGTDLRGRAKSDFTYGALDQILHDVRDVADKKTIAEIDAGAFEVRTVDDYCKHMMRCYRTNEKEVAKTLEADRHTAT